MHLQSSRGEGGGFEIKKPCCSPAAYRPLDILHLDQVLAFELCTVHCGVYVQAVKVCNTSYILKYKSFILTQGWIFFIGFIQPAREAR